MVNSLTPEWLKLYFRLGLDCCEPILEAVRHCPSFHPRSITEIWNDLLEDQGRHPDLAKANRVFSRLGWQCWSSGRGRWQAKSPTENVEILKSAGQHLTSYLLSVETVGLEYRKFTIEWKIPRHESEQIHFVIQRWKAQDQQGFSLQLHGHVDEADLETEMKDRTLWKTALDHYELD